ncbi:NADH-quinone oxidoreductase subunit NuoN [Cellulomonas sp. PhB143]|uniref:NADH-quinone oxidoreductase subunit NuoN n=1 Tax=Cellulomonas sp. PhB143 TaxID=2485186 RepID=UPI000F49C2CB|nr:NADH-quinone oxidoreductase subunit NuoN [Cellulomonas sp. PhB143]ROS76721.1 NADH dehydrogenase subunit N [Cellulomonas sp. PhB143]
MSSFFAPTVDWAALAPVLVVLGAGVVGVLVEAFVPARARRATQLTLALAALVGAFVAIAVLWHTVRTEGGRSVLGGAYQLDGFGASVQAVVVVLAAVAVLVIADRSAAGQDAFAPSAAAVPGTPYEDLAQRRGLEQTEVFPLTLFATGGMMIFPAAGDLLTMFVALEVLSLPLYVLTATARRRRLLSQEASFKYFLLGAFASALFLFGTALLYGAAGSVKITDLGQALGQAASGPDGVGAMALVGALFVLAGLLFKVGAAPFHLWTPDVYQGAPTPVTGFMAACTKAAAFGAMIRVLVVVGAGMRAGLPDAYDGLVVALWAAAIASMVVGTVVSLLQVDMKRILGYSAVAHTGFILVGVVGMLAAADGDALGSALSSLVFYLLAYGLAVVGAFAVVTLVRETSSSTARAEQLVGASGATAPEPGASPAAPTADEAPVVLGEATHLSQWVGLGRRSPWLAALFSLFLLSMAGIPLTAGFVAKFGVFSSAVAGGSWVLALVGVLASAVAVFFYVRIIVLMYFTSPEEGEGADAVTALRPRAPVLVALVLCAAGVLGLGVFPSSVLGLLG